MRLTPDSLSDLGGGACFNDARVQVEKRRVERRMRSEVRNSKGVSSNFSLRTWLDVLRYRRQLAAATAAGLSAFAAGATRFFSGPFVRGALGVSGTAALAGNFALLFC